jgi:2-keto-4-pentenoate hydratase/2-oxohepta-3-ene-1,7-dioic acid hydratase in catechol pathway
LYGSGFARPGNLFFQNVDAIIGPDEPIVYPEHLTEELDYELELAVVLKNQKSIFLRLFLVQPSTH